jgi:hypothetical protein
MTKRRPGTIITSPARLLRLRENHGPGGGLPSAKFQEQT